MTARRLSHKSIIHILRWILYNEKNGENWKQLLYLYDLERSSQPAIIDDPNTELQFGGYK